MGKYLQVSFFTLTGVRKIIDLGPIYGEWIIYDGLVPKYHVVCFDNFPSNKLVKLLISSKKETIESILKKINIKNGTKLSLGKGWPWILINQKEKHVTLELPPLPFDLINNIA